MKFGSLFTGIGGLDLGLERAEMQCCWQSEIDRYASLVLAKRFPEVPNLGDITQIDYANVERVDMVCGGFPCQPHSLAGKRKGDADERDLWPEVVRCLREVAPRWFLGENVAGLLSSNDGRMFAGILGDLAALGYDATWCSVRASDFGAPHRRERVFIVAYRTAGEIVGNASVNGGRTGFPQSEERIWRRRSKDASSALADAGDRQLSQPRWRPETRDGAGSAGADVSDASRKGLEKRGRISSGTDGGACPIVEPVLPPFPPAPNDRDGWFYVLNRWPWLAPSLSEKETESMLRGMANGFPSPLDSRASRLKTLGNAVVPQIAQFVAEVILAVENRKYSNGAKQQD